MFICLFYQTFILPIFTLLWQCAQVAQIRTNLQLLPPRLHPAALQGSRQRTRPGWEREDQAENIYIIVIIGSIIIIRIVLIAIDVAPVERRAATDPKPESWTGAGLLLLFFDRRVPANILIDWGIFKTQVELKITPNFGCDQRYSLTHCLSLLINLYIFSFFLFLFHFQVIYIQMLSKVPIYLDYLH